MTLRARLLVVVAWIVSLVAVGAWAGGQQPIVKAVQRPAPPAPVVIAGENLGFRVDSEAGGVKRGRLVVRVDDEWVEVEFSMKVTPVK